MIRKSFHIALLFLFFIAFPSTHAAASAKQVHLQVIEKTIRVNGKKSKVFGIQQRNGKFGLTGKEGDLFNVVVENKTQVPLVLHWHGILSPNDDDGVPYVTQLPIQPGESYPYEFKLKQAGTYWFHSHYKLQEQKLMAAPLIIYGANEKPEKEAMLFIQDFTFENPREVYAKLRGNLQQAAASSDKMPMNMPTMGKKMAMPDVSDVKFDAYLTNHRTLSNPQVIRVKPGETVRLRIINGSASSNYYVDLGKLQGTLFAVDAEPVQPVQGSRFQLAIGNRLDIRVQIPPGQGAYPILALPEGTRQRTGLILATTHAAVPRLSETTESVNPVLNDEQEKKLKALHPFPLRPIKQSLLYNLEGDMKTYRWTINGEVWPYVTPYKVKPNQRIELYFNNKSGMAHPMHFHGHVFQITEINGKKINGRKGDSVNVMPHSTMKVVLDTENPGIWMLHCHILYHQMGGMMTTVNYENYPERFTTEQRVKGEQLYDLSPF